MRMGTVRNMKPGQIVRLIDNEGYERFPVDALGVFLREDNVSTDNPHLEPLAVIYFPGETPAHNPATLFEHRLIVVGEVQDA